MSGASWKFMLARSRDLRNLGELDQARDRQLQLILDHSGSLSFSVPMSDDLGSQIYPIEYAVKAIRFGSQGGEEVWSGYVNTVEEDALNDRMNVSCVGWYDRLAKRLLMKDLSFENTDDAEIAKALLAHANAGLEEGEYPTETTSAVMPTAPDGDYTVYWPAGSEPNTPTWLKWGGTLPDEGRGGATAYVGADRTIPSLPHFQTVIATEIQSLVDIENGYDWWIDPVTREFFIYRRRCNMRSEVVFGYRFGPENVAQFNRQIDGSTLANFGIATGGVYTPQGYPDEESQGYYGPFEEVYSLSDAKSLDVLRAYAVGEIALKRNPRQLYSITPFNWTAENSVPEPFVDYDLGDQVGFVAYQEPRISINQQVRIFGISVSIDAEGNEKLGQLQVTPQ